MITGSVLANFSELELSTADDRHFRMKMNPLSRIALRTIGLPHLGFRERARIILREAARVATRDSKILDAGCGYGLYSLSLAAKGLGSIDSIDIDPARTGSIGRMLSEDPELAKNISLHTGSITSLPFPDNAYDLIICSEVIEHIADHGSAVKELTRTLKPGGTLLLSVPTDSRFNQKTYKRFDHQRPGYSKQTLSSMLASHGVSIEKDYYYEYAPGALIFNAFNTISSKPLMGALFYPFYLLFWLDSILRIGQPNYTIIRARKSVSA